MRVLVVDDSALMRKMITQMINSDPQMNVVGSAIDGLDALKKIRRLHPDVVTLDVVMPRMDGLTTLKHIMKKRPLPVIMLSTATQKGAETTFKALEYGAIDYVPKPSGQISLDINKIKTELTTKIKTAMYARIVTHKHVTRSPIQIRQKLKEKVITIGASTGGPPALKEILSQLPKNTPPMLIAQHMPPIFTKSFAKTLGQFCSFTVKEAEEGDPIRQGQALVAPGGYDMTVTKDKRIHLDTGSCRNCAKPTVDPLMKTAANTYESKTIGVILTGMGKDGASGMKTIKERGGVTIAQDEATCAVFGMPKAAIQAKCIDKILPLSQIPQEIVRMCQM